MKEVKFQGDTLRMDTLASFSSLDICEKVDALKQFPRY